jgi:hypothetical protein
MDYIWSIYGISPEQERHRYGTDTVQHLKQYRFLTEEILHIILHVEKKVIYK